MMRRPSFSSVVGVRPDVARCAVTVSKCSGTKAEDCTGTAVKFSRASNCVPPMVWPGSAVNCTVATSATGKLRAAFATAGTRLSSVTDEKRPGGSATVKLKFVSGALAVRSIRTFTV